jgi:1-acyl-sn-glycerol-3-phosphate acyltransferase
LIYRIARALSALLVGLRVRVRIVGADSVPTTGGVLLVLNHRSLLDAAVSQIACPRPVRAMTKSTEFRRPLVARLLTLVGAFPVRRYRVDPQAVRTVLRCLARGEVVAIYAEGERSWDGRLQPFRRGTLRLLLGAGAPIVPCALEGTYEAWPRWSRRIARANVTVRFGQPFSLGHHRGRAAREAALPEAERVLTHALFSLGAPGARERAR